MRTVEAMPERLSVFYGPSVTVAAAMVGLSLATAVRAQVSGGSPDAYPSKPVRVIVGLAPGGGTDILARLFAQKLTSTLGRPFVVDSRPGAGGTVAYASVAKSPADQVTRCSLLPAAIRLRRPSTRIFPTVPSGFAPISLVAEAPILLMVHPSLPVRSTRELLALAKSKAGALDAASAGVGISNHLALELFNNLAGVRIVHIHTRNRSGARRLHGRPGADDVRQHRVVTASRQGGRARVLAVTSAKRSAVVPDVPTVAESGVPTYVTTTWHGWLAPAGTPPPIVNKLSAELARAARSPDLLDQLAADGAEPVGSTPVQFNRHLVTRLRAGAISSRMLALTWGIDYRAA